MSRSRLMMAGVAANWLHGGADQEVFNAISGGGKGARRLGFSGKLPAGDADIWKLVA